MSAKAELIIGSAALYVITPQHWTHSSFPKCRITEGFKADAGKNKNVREVSYPRGHHVSARLGVIIPVYFWCATNFIRVPEGWADVPATEGRARRLIEIPAKFWSKGVIGAAHDEGDNR